MSMSKPGLLNQRVEKLMSLNDNSGQLDWGQLRGPWILSFLLWTAELRPARCLLWVACSSLSAIWTFISMAALLLLDALSVHVHD